MEHIERVLDKLTKEGYSKYNAMHVLILNFGHDEEIINHILRLVFSEAE